MSSVSNPVSNSLTSSPVTLARERVRSLAVEARFDEAGIIGLPYAEEARDALRFREWIGAGRAGSMHYLKRADEDGRLVRERTALPFPWARSAIVCFCLYRSEKLRSIDTPPEGAGWIARYATTSRIHPDGVRRPSDYHKVLLKRLQSLDLQLHEGLGEFASRAYVDTGPVVERSLAAAAGLGWTGKNTCLIHPKLGSFGFLAVLLTSLPVEAEQTPTVVPDRCGTCRRCIEACPTEALIAPYQMDATRCISYLTIEHKGPIPTGLMEGTGRQVFGCDICQDVCPWNHKAPIASHADLTARPELVNPALEWLAAMDEGAFEQQFNGSPVRRTGFWGLRRNTAVAMGNSGQPRFLPWLEAWTSAADEGVRTAAQWALDKLRKNARS
ncbi:MAG TPA: tRNA epoxyqueuosine(34) reductase QueG [Terracidiphilus sp.]